MKRLVLSLRSFFLVSSVLACGGSSAPAPSGVDPSSPQPPAGDPPSGPISPGGCPARDEIHVEKDGTTLVTRFVTGQGPGTIPEEAEPAVATFDATTEQSGANGAYEQVFVYLRAIEKGTSTPSNQTSLEYRKYPAIPAGQTGVVPTEQAVYAGPTLLGTVTVETPPATKAGDAICGAFDLRGVDSTLRVHGAFHHVYKGPQPGSR